jgi:hypothetical protein
VLKGWSVERMAYWEYREYGGDTASMEGVLRVWKEYWGYGGNIGEYREPEVYYTGSMEGILGSLKN